MVESNPALAAPIFLLGFIFYADNAATSLADWKPAHEKGSKAHNDGGLYLSFPLTLGLGDRCSRLAVGKTDDDIVQQTVAIRRNML